MAYTKYNDPWADSPSTSTPITAAALDHIEQGIADAIPKTISGVATDKVPVYNGSDWVAQKIVNAQIDSAAAIDLSKVSVPRVVARRTANQSISTATWTLLTWDAEDEDTDTIHSTGSNPARLTAKTAGLYQFSVFLEIDSNTTGIRALFVQKNSEALPESAGTGAYVGGFAQSAPSTAVTMTVTTSGIVRLAVNDYICLVLYQDSGTSLVIDKDSSYFAMHRVAS